MNAFTRSAVRSVVNLVSHVRRHALGNAGTTYAPILVVILVTDQDVTSHARRL